MISLGRSETGHILYAAQLLDPLNKVFRARTTVFFAPRFPYIPASNLQVFQKDRGHPIAIGQGRNELRWSPLRHSLQRAG